MTACPGRAVPEVLIRSYLAWGGEAQPGRQPLLLSHWLPPAASSVCSGAKASRQNPGAGRECLELAVQGGQVGRGRPVPQLCWAPESLPAPAPQDTCPSWGDLGKGALEFGSLWTGALGGQAQGGSCLSLSGHVDAKLGRGNGEALLPSCRTEGAAGYSAWLFWVLRVELPGLRPQALNEWGILPSCGQAGERQSRWYRSSMMG